MVYVDEILIMRKNTETLKLIKETLGQKFKMQDMGEVNWVLDMKICIKDDEIYV